MRVLIVESIKEKASFLKKGFTAECFVADTVDSADKAGSLIKVNEYDLVVLTIDLGDSGGLELCQRLQDEQKPIPIIILTNDRRLNAKIKAFELGADDYLIRPFSFRELLVRARALLRRGKLTNGHKLQVADLELDTKKHLVKRKNKSIKLNRKEFLLLEYFMRNLGTVLTRTMILEHVWDMSVDPFTNTIDVHIKYLREKIGQGFKRKLIHTVHGYGYKLE